jgi:hypothetical protein
MKQKRISTEEILKIILTEMCNIVNVDYNSIDFHNNDDLYFMKYSWTNEEQESFKQWMIKLFKENKHYYKAFTQYPRILKIEKAVNFFVDNHGWKTKIKETI